jgi:hypothetical protein
VLALQRAAARAGGGGFGFGGGRLVLDEGREHRFYAALGDVDGCGRGFGDGAARLAALDGGLGARRRHPLALGA